MLLNKQAIDEFKRLYLKENLIRITTKEAVEFGSRLICLVKAVYGDSPSYLKGIDRSLRKEKN